jgi:hypothetical protein
MENEARKSLFFLSCSKDKGLFWKKKKNNVKNNPGTSAHKISI